MTLFGSMADNDVLEATGHIVHKKVTMADARTQTTMEKRTLPMSQLSAGEVQILLQRVYGLVSQLWVQI